MDFWYFQKIYRMKWKLIMMFAIIMALFAALGSKIFLTPTYISSVSLYFGKVTTNSEPTQKDISTTQQLSLGMQLIGDYRELIFFDVIKEGVLDELAAYTQWKNKPYEISVDLLNQSRIMQISILSSDPYYSQALANTYARQFVNEIQQVVGIKNAQIINEASFNPKPVKPIIMLNAIYGLVFGFFLAFFFFIVRALLDRTIKTPTEAAEKFHLPVLGVVQEDKYLYLEDNNPILFSGTSLADNTLLAEDFRVLRVNLINRKTRQDGSGSVIAVTSSSAKEGKTFCTANIAASLAEAGCKVLLIDCDTGKNGLQSLLAEKKTLGLMNILDGETNFEDVVKCEINKLPLDLLFCGNKESNSANLMISKKFKQLIEDVRKKYEYVFLDISTNRGRADAVTAGSCADAVLLLIRANKTEEELIHQTAESLQRAQLPVTGIIINGVDSI